MDHSTDLGIKTRSSTPAARALARSCEEVLQNWEKRCREEIKSAANLLHPVLINTVPSFLANLVEALAEEHPRELATSSSNVAQEHGGERARLSKYGPDQLILEYQILRDCVLAKLANECDLKERDRDIIQRSFDQGICEAMTAFFLVHCQIREQFVAGLTHDLRTPLTAVKAASELISDGLTGEMQTFAQMISINIGRMDRMIQDLLDATSIHMGERIPLHLAHCDLHKIVDGVVADLPKPARERLRVNGPNIKGYWDESALRRAIENLVTNAIKYGVAQTQVTINLGSEHQRATLQIHNEGAEIPIDQRELLFQAFKRTESAKASKQKGWGIGLALVRGIAESHGGSIGVDSTSHGGTTFMLDLPLDAKPYQPAE